jgi:transketolase N-terminal domain/subunit/transketolase C-terminal domain/subunit
MVRKGVLQLLAIKDSDIRILTLEQARDAVDKGLHSGGAFSATIPLVTLFYGGFINLDLADPTRRGQDMFVLSKGHAVAAMASIYAELGYFDRSLLKNSRSYESILNGHPGPLLPGVQISTGPMGQGFAVAQGLAIAGKSSPRFDSYCMVGDGELQEGTIWETVMFAAQKRLDNLCVLIDRNHGQLDVHDRTVFPMPDVESVFASFGWQVSTVDATSYDAVYDALDNFRNHPRNGKPTAIVCSTNKGHGAFSDGLNKHKITVNEKLAAQEIALQTQRRHERMEDFLHFYNSLAKYSDGEELQFALEQFAQQIHLDISHDDHEAVSVDSITAPVLTRPVPPRDKRVLYDASLLPQLDSKKEYAASDIVTAAMKIFARDSRIVSIDADLGSTSGLQPGVGSIDQSRALNTGVAEANMMNIGEAFAVLGHNAWVSTFCPFFNWQVLRRIAVGQQERLESIQARNGWLTEGHGLDLNFLATAPNFETRVNGATHMGNDDSLVFDAMAHLKIIDVSCPQQLIAIMRWIMDGNRGLTYVRIMRAGSKVIYGPDYTFEFGKASIVRENPNDSAVIVTSGRGVHEAIATASLCAENGISVGIVDMHSIDEAKLIELCKSGKFILIAEQNNGYIWQNLLKTIARHHAFTTLAHVKPINTLDPDGRPQFIHSATYEQLLTAYQLSPAQLAKTIQEQLGRSK